MTFRLQSDQQSVSITSAFVDVFHYSGDQAGRYGAVSAAAQHLVVGVSSGYRRTCRFVAYVGCCRGHLFCFARLVVSFSSSSFFYFIF